MDSGKPRKTLVRAVFLRTEIKTQILPNVKREL